MWVTVVYSAATSCAAFGPPSIAMVFFKRTPQKCSVCHVPCLGDPDGDCWTDMIHLHERSSQAVTFIAVMITILLLPSADGQPLLQETDSGDLDNSW